MAQTPSGVPILRLWNRLLVTLQGDISDQVAEAMANEILEIIHQEPTDGLVLDITGVLTLDSHLSFVLSRLAASAKLMGVPTIVSGMSAPTAQTLETMGVRLRTMQTAQSAEAALEMLGVKVSIESTSRAFTPAIGEVAPPVPLREMAKRGSMHR
jgi:rsbT antagonist protein RsbS